MASPILLGQITQTLVAGVEAYAKTNGIPLVHLAAGQRKDAGAARYRQKFTATEGVVFIGVAPEKYQAFQAHKPVRAGTNSFDFSRQAVYVKVYYVYVPDAAFGPAFIKVGTCAPFPVKVCLNGQEWAKQQLRQAGVAFEALHNGFVRGAAPERWQTICQPLGPEPIQAVFDQGTGRLPWPLTAADRAVGYGHRLSSGQMDAYASRTHVCTRPLRGREFFEHVIRENRDLGRPDRVQLIFGRRVQRKTPSRFLTRVIQAGVQPNW